MTSHHSDAPDIRQSLSELLDGEADGAAELGSLLRWAEDAEVRRTWHSYHLIGDVMRSEELAATAQHDAEFLATFRARLSTEPVVLGPTPSIVSPTIRGQRRSWSRWAVPAAMAFGLVAVTGVLIVVQPNEPTTLAGSPALASVAQPDSNQGESGARRVVQSPQGQMLRDVRVDDYLRAHRATLAGSPAALPGGAMRNVDLVAPQQ